LVGKPDGKRPLGRPRRRWLDNIRMDLVKVGWVMWARLVWLRIGTGGELLWIRYWTFGLHKMLGNYRVSKQLWLSRVVLSCMELVNGYTICFLWYWKFKYYLNKLQVSKKWKSVSSINVMNFLLNLRLGKVKPVSDSSARVNISYLRFISVLIFNAVPKTFTLKMNVQWASPSLLMHPGITFISTHRDYAPAQIWGRRWRSAAST
jgi:hypothetical protein